MKTADLRAKLFSPCTLKKIVFCLSFGLAGHFSSTVFAATNHWTGASCAATGVGNCEWGTAENWLEHSGHSKDGKTDILFAGAAGLTPLMNDNWNVRSVIFDTTAGAFVCAGDGHTLTIQAGIANNGLNPQPIGVFVGSTCPIALGAPQT